MIPLLWRAQEQAGGWVPEAAIRYVAEFLEHGAYPRDGGRDLLHHVQSRAGRALPCADLRHDALHAARRRRAEESAISRIGDQFDVTADGKFSWVEVECLGACVNAPMAQINYDFYEDLTPENFNTLLDELAAGKEPKPGPQIDRQFSAPDRRRRPRPSRLARCEAPARTSGKRQMMLEDKDRIFKNLYGLHDWGLKGARARGAWDGTKAIIDKGRDGIINEMKASGLRGRGGAGFPTGMKWSFMPKESGRPAELSRGQCRRVRARHLQGPRDHAARSASAGRGLPDRRLRDGRGRGYIYVRGEFIRERERLQAAIDQAYEAKLIGKNNIHGWDFDLYVHHGAGAYICGEETALLESLEGKKGMPRLKPPFPANVGLYGCPTTVNNVELIAVAPDIMRRGAAWFAGIGRPNNTGTKLFCISGHVNKPCNVEEAMGIPFRELIDKHAGGIRGGWDNLLAVIPGGSSVPCVPAAQCGDDLFMDFDTLEEPEIRSRHRRGDRDGQVHRHRARDRAHLLFLQARELRPMHAVPRGHRLDVARATRMAEGRAQKREIDLLLDVAGQVEGHTICALGDAAAWPVQGLIRHFRREIEKRIDRLCGQSAFRSGRGGGGVIAMAAANQKYSMVAALRERRADHVRGRCDLRLCGRSCCSSARSGHNNRAGSARQVYLA